MSILKIFLTLEKDEDRAKNPEWLVMLGICTHLKSLCSAWETRENIMDGFVRAMDLTKYTSLGE